MSLAEKQQSLIDDLNIIHDPHERLNAVVSREKQALCKSESCTIL